MHHIINSMKCINQSLYDTYPNKDISFTISKYQLSSVSPHVQLLKVPKIKCTSREILSSKLTTITFNSNPRFSFQSIGEDSCVMEIPSYLLRKRFPREN